MKEFREVDEVREFNEVKEYDSVEEEIQIIYIPSQNKRSYKKEMIIGLAIPIILIIVFILSVLILM